MEKTYTTGQFAKQAGVSVRTVRYYDQIGLLKPSFLNKNGYRGYHASDLSKLQKITALKLLGFPLDEIKILLMEENQERMETSLDMQISMLDQKIQHMTILKESLISAKKMIKEQALDWQSFSELAMINAQDEKISDHYRNANHLSIRIRLHEMFSTNQKGWFPWILEHIDFQNIYRLLEIGCGDGTMWKNCTVNLRNREIFLSDVSEGMVDTVRQSLGEEYSYMVLDCQKIPFKKRYFDAVIANHMLFYVNEIDVALQEINRVLRDQGALYCTAYGASHMQEITNLVKEFDERIELSDQILSDRFGLENGKQLLQRYFQVVQLITYDDALEVDQIQPLVDYIMSCHGNQNELLADRMEEFAGFLEKKIDEFGMIKITKDAGMFICKKIRR